MALGVAQRGVHRGELGQHPRMGRREAQRLLPLHHRFAQPQGDVGNPLLGPHGPHRVEIVRLGHAGNRRVEEIAVGVAHQFLDDHRHGFFLGLVGRAAGKGLGAFVVGGSIDELDGGHEVREAHGQIRVVVGNHVGLVEAGVGLELGVFQQARGAHRQRARHLGEKHFQVRHEPLRHGGIEERPSHPLVGGILHRQTAQVVGLDEGLEPVGADHQGLGNLDVNARVLFVDACILLQESRHEGQPPGLAAQGPRADLDEVHDLGIEGVSLELGHYALLLPLAHLLDAGDDEAAHLPHLAEIVGLHLAELGGQGDFRAAHDPLGEMVALGVVEQRLVGNRRQQGLKGAQVVGFGDGGPVRAAEDEGAETEVVEKKGVQLAEKARGVLVEKHRRNGVGVGAVFRGRTEQEQRQVRNLGTDVREQGHAGVLPHSTVAGNAGVGNDSQQVGPVAMVELQGLLVIGGQQDLGPGAHSQQAVLLVESDPQHGLGLANDFLVDKWQKRRIVDR